MKKIIVVDSCRFASDSSIYSTLESLGTFECSYLNYRQGAAYQNKFIRGLLRKIPSLRPLKNYAMRNTNRKLLDMVAQVKPDLVLIIEGDNVTFETINNIKSQGILVANWFIDFVTHWHIIEKITPYYDYFFTSDKYVLDRLQSKGLQNSFYLPFGVEDFYPRSPFEKRDDKYNISLVASYAPGLWTKRDELLSSIRDLGLNIWGPPAWKKSPLRDYYRGQASGKKMFEIYRQSKFVVDIPWDKKTAHGISLRPTEAMISGAALLMYDIRPDMEKLFKKNEEYIPFLSGEELRTKVTYYLEHEEERIKIAKRGYEVTHQNYTYASRLKEMISIMGIKP